MAKILYFIFVILLIAGFSTSVLQAQMDGLFGTDDEYRMGVHAGNLFRTTFFNDGTYGGRTNQPDQIAGEWPINSGHLYLVDGNVFVGSEVVDNKGNLIHIMSENKSADIGGSAGDKDPVTQEWWTFLPLPGFANSAEDKIAMAKGSSEWEDSWPGFWPDKFDDPTDPGWRNDNVDKNPGKAAWNGYFGKNVFNADEESYFVADDYMNREFDFFPDSLNTNRRGLGIRAYVRGFQWSKAAVEDALFCLFDLENIGTHLHDKMVFGYKIGNNMGETVSGSDAGDDTGAFDKETDIAYMWDENHDGAADWGPDPVGYFGGAFLESPGNPYDGIDNDNDGSNFSGPTISESMFQPKILDPNDPIVIINYNTFSRYITTLADTLAQVEKDTLEILYNTRTFKFWAGKVMEEIGDNLVDDNLNGLIDENRGAEDELGVIQYLYIDNGVGYKYIDYTNPDPFSNGMNNPLLDERRDDGIDNDVDWDPLSDDTGVDGLLPGDLAYPGPDFGEMDGSPTFGEPHFDKTDIDETDMLGLTSFLLYNWSNLNQFDDEGIWNGLTPGGFTYTTETSNIELLYGSGYFPLIPGQIERFSMALIAGGGMDTEDLFRNKENVALAYNQNYNFSKAPYIPTVRAIAGDNRVTLFWDDFAEKSFDPVSDQENEGKDFEGYRIYRSTDPGFNDMNPITDGYGTSYLTPLFRKPIAQFDLDNKYSGFAAVPTQGVQFYLGDNTGLRHFWIDETAVNGFRYFYAVTSYDHGDPILGIDPSECTKFVAVSASGEIEKGTNVVVVRPEAPSAGFVPADFKDGQIVGGANNTASGSINYEIIDPSNIKPGHRYTITFQDSLNSNNLRATQSFTLFNETSNDTLLKNHTLEGGSYGLPITEGFQLSFSGNQEELNLNPDSSGWNRPGIPAYTFRPYSARNQVVELVASDFEIIMNEVGIDTSIRFMYRGTELCPAIPVNFTVLNTSTNEPVDFAFRERDALTPEDSGKFSCDFQQRRYDEIIFLVDKDSLVTSWQVLLTSAGADEDTIMPGVGDVLTLKLNKPFLSHDSYSFQTLAAGVNNRLAKSDLKKIKVVPNPYIVTNSWEPKNPYANGRGERQLHFTHLPAACTIKIFNVRGQLVDTIEHKETINDGTEIWNMLSKDNLEIAYGIYIYHVKAEGIGETVGKFVVVK
jgi:hypothetical protein